MKLTICDRCEGENLETGLVVVELKYNGKEKVLELNGAICKDCGEENISKADYYLVLSEMEKMKEEILEERGGDRNVRILQ